MPVTPLDILQKQFGPARKGGYEPEEVHAFLDQVRESLESVLRENLRLREELSGREGEIATLRGESVEVKEALVMARRLVQELEANARREADLLIGEARLESERILSTVHDEERVLQEHLLRLKTARLHHLAQMRALVSAQARMLDELEEDPG